MKSSEHTHLFSDYQGPFTQWFCFFVFASSAVQHSQIIQSGSNLQKIKLFLKMSLQVRTWPALQTINTNVTILHLVNDLRDSQTENNWSPVQLPSGTLYIS
jgi:hypothetical protein